MELSLELCNTLTSPPSPVTATVTAAADDVSDEDDDDGDGDDGVPGVELVDGSTCQQVASARRHQLAAPAHNIVSFSMFYSQ